MKTLAKPLFATEPLNNLFKNLAEARLIFVGGQPARMKLNFLLNLFQRHQKNVRNVPVLITETGRDYLIEKWEALGLKMYQNVACFKNDSEPVFFLDEINGWDIEKAGQQIRNLHHLYKLSFVVIDSFENIGNNTCYMDRDTGEDILEKLRCLSFELRLPIVIFSDLSPNIEQHKGHKKHSRLSDLYTERFMFMPDYIILFRRPEYYQTEIWEDGTSRSNELELIFEKTPSGISFSQKFLFHYNERNEVVFPEILSE